MIYDENQYLNASSNDNDLNWVRETIPTTTVEKSPLVMKESEEDNDDTLFDYMD